MYYIRRAVTVVAVLALLVGSANASMFYSFYKITNNGNPDVSGQLSVEVIDSGIGKADFKFTNAVGTASSITDIYFDDGTLLGIASITQSTGVSFDHPAVPGDLPGGDSASPPFVTTAGFSADSDNPPVAKGVNALTEWVTITFNLKDGKTWDDVITDLETGELRIGLHVQGIGLPGGSDGYINYSPPNIVPEPTSLATWGVLAGACLFGTYRRRKKV